MTVQSVPGQMVECARPISGLLECVRPNGRVCPTRRRSAPGQTTECVRPDKRVANATGAVDWGASHQIAIKQSADEKISSW